MEFRLPRARRIFVLIGTAVLGCVSAGFTVFAIVVMLSPQWQLGLFLLAPLAGFMGALTGYVGRDLRGVWGLHVVLGGDSLELDLPAGRSLIHRPPVQRLIVPYVDIAAVETRLEAYSTLGMEIVQRAYALRRKSEELIFLFEDRALATGLESADFQQLAADIASRAGVPLHDLGMVEGKAGFLAVWGAQAPDWSAPSLPLALQLRIWRHAAATGSLVFAIVIVALAIQRLVGTG